MAALGAGAGAHKGEMDSRAIAQREVEGEQAHQRGMMAIEQNDQHFKMNFGQQQANKEKEDGWKDVLNKLEVEQKEQEFAKNNEVLEKYREARKIEREQIDNRQRLAHSHTGAMFMDVMENNGVGSQAGLNIFNEATGQNIKGMYVVEDKGMAFDYEDENGETKTNFIPMSVAREYASALYGSDQFGGKGGSESAMQSALNSAERNRLTAEANAERHALAEERHKLTRGQGFLRSIELQITSLREQREFADPEEQVEIDAKIRAFEKKHEEVSMDVHGDFYKNEKAGGQRPHWKPKPK